MAINHYTMLDEGRFRRFLMIKAGLLKGDVEALPESEWQTLLKTQNGTNLNAVIRETCGKEPAAHKRSSMLSVAVLTTCEYIADCADCHDPTTPGTFSFNGQPAKELMFAGGRLHWNYDGVDHPVMYAHHFTKFLQKRVNSPDMGACARAPGCGEAYEQAMNGATCARFEDRTAYVGCDADDLVGDCGTRDISMRYTLEGEGPMPSSCQALFEGCEYCQTVDFPQGKSTP
jgi:hypothetical protein